MVDSLSILGKLISGSDFLKIIVNGIKHITNSKGDNKSPWKMPRFIATSPILADQHSNFTFHVFTL